MVWLPDPTALSGGATSKATSFARRPSKVTASLLKSAKSSARRVAEDGSLRRAQLFAGVRATAQDSSHFLKRVATLPRKAAEAAAAMREDYGASSTPAVASDAAVDLAAARSRPTALTLPSCMSPKFAMPSPLMPSPLSVSSWPLDDNSCEDFLAEEEAELGCLSWGSFDRSSDDDPSVTPDARDVDLEVDLGPAELHSESSLSLLDDLTAANLGNSHTLRDAEEAAQNNRRLERKEDGCQFPKMLSGSEESLIEELFCATAVSTDSTSWDWPLSRCERGKRALMAARHMQMIDRQVLLQALIKERITSRRARVETSEVSILAEEHGSAQMLGDSALQGA